MTDLIKRLRIAARKACERHNNVDQFDPAWERKPEDFIEWEAADRIEKLEGDLQVARLQRDARMVSEFVVDDAVKAEIERLRNRIEQLQKDNAEKDHALTVAIRVAKKDKAEIEQLEAALGLISNPGDVTDAEELGWIAREALERIG